MVIIAWHCIEREAMNMKKGGDVDESWMWCVVLFILFVGISAAFSFGPEKWTGQTTEWLAKFGLCCCPLLDNATTESHRLASLCLFGSPYAHHADMLPVSKFYSASVRLVKQFWKWLLCFFFCLYFLVRKKHWTNLYLGER